MEEQVAKLPESVPHAIMTMKIVISDLFSLIHDFNQISHWRRTYHFTLTDLNDEVVFFVSTACNFLLHRRDVLTRCSFEQRSFQLPDFLCLQNKDPAWQEEKSLVAKRGNQTGFIFHNGGISWLVCSFKSVKFSLKLFTNSTLLRLFSHKLLSEKLAKVLNDHISSSECR